MLLEMQGSGENLASWAAGDSMGAEVWMGSTSAVWDA